jgi:ankyrin repeat protein
MAEMLLERGADPNGQVYASGTPLSEAYGQRDERMIALLERYGGKSNASMAGLYRRADLARHLLKEFGDTPLPDDGCPAVGCDNCSACGTWRRSRSPMASSG